ncbi:MAG: family 16 glycoside hydrolase [Pirellulales bacterium]
MQRLPYLTSLRIAVTVGLLNICPAKEFPAMCRFALLLLFALSAVGTLALAVIQSAAADGQEDGFEAIFDGKSLKGWDGNPKFWSVEEGAITGRTTAENPTKGNTFLVWRKEEVGDFELRIKFRIDGGNSGIQYRSREIDRWVIGGYQADFDAARKWTGILYDERGRGVLAHRGTRVIVRSNGRKDVVGRTAEEAAIKEAVAKKGWGDYTVIARGNHLEHRVNGVTTVDVTDDQKARRRLSGLLALQVHAGPPMTVQFKDIRFKRLGSEHATRTPTNVPQDHKGSSPRSEADGVRRAVGTGAKRIRLLAGKPSHGYGTHEHYAGCLLLAHHLQRAFPEFDVAVIRGGWPSDPSLLEGVDAVVMYCDGGSGHPAMRHLDQLEAMVARGVGIAFFHYGVEVPKGPGGQALLDAIGGYFEANWSVNPHWTAHFRELPAHPITRGVAPFEIYDEWYYHMRFRRDMEGITPILTDLPSATTLSRPDGPHSGNRAVRAAIAGGEPQHVAWAYERPGGGRGFGFTGGHFHWNWAEPNFRKLALNAIVWVAGREVPAEGVASPSPSFEQLEANLDESAPANFDPTAVRERLGL